MNFPSLQTKVRKLLVRDWGTEEIRAWCCHIELPEYAHLIAESAQTGSRLQKLTAEDFTVILGGPNYLKPLHLRKILKWTKHLLSEFDEFVEKEWNYQITTLTLYPLQSSSKVDLKKACELIGDTLEIGSGQYVDLKIDSVDISERHARIVLVKGKDTENTYTLQDLGSDFGCYVRVQDTSLRESLTFLMGSHLFEIAKISYSSFLDSKAKVTLTMNITSFQSGCLLEQTHSFYLQQDDKCVYRIGRKPENNIFYESDTELSTKHAEIYLKNDGSVFLRDCSSKNGVWARLDSSTNATYVLHEGMRIKFGIHNEFHVAISKQKPNRNSSGKKGISFNPIEVYCVRCKGRKHNTQLIPCLHSVYCQDCLRSEQLSQFPDTEQICPVCSKKYRDFIELCL